MKCPHCQAENPGGESVCFECGRALAAITKGSVLAERYQVLEVLGRGGMGVVYKAHDQLLDELVAIKVLKPELLAEPEAAQRFRNEIKLARRVSHPNVCRIHEYGRYGDLSYISMAFVDGQDLRERLAGFPEGLPAEEAYDVAIQAARGLQAIHDAGVIHRDFKTPNIMREADGTVRLMDFGIAKESAAAAGQGLTGTGMVVGTPEFMSPEQCRGQQLDARSDVYSLGVVIYELFTGRVPFRGDSLMATVMKHLEEPPPLEGPGAERLPPALVPVLRKALAKAADQRYGRAIEVALALERARSAPAAAAVTPPSERRAAAPPSERRAATRLDMPLDVSIQRLDAAGVALDRERTLADNVSRTGLRVMTSLASIEVGELVQVEEVGGDFLARARVANRHRPADGIWRLGLELVGAQMPDRLVRTGEWTSAVERPPTGPRPAVAAPARPATPPPRPAPPPLRPPAGPPAGGERRSSTRIRIPLELTLERLGPDGQPRERERTVAEDVGRGGAQVLTALSSVTVGEVVRVREQGGDFETRATVRSVHLGADRIQRLSLQFLDRQAPDRLVPADLTPAGGTRTVPARPPAGSGPVPAAPRPGPTPAPAPAAGAPRTPPAATPAAPTPAAVRREELLELFASLKGLSHYEALGIPRHATEAQVREAYAGLVRRLHPDKLRASGITDLQAEVGAIMARLADAQRVLTDTRRRADYEQQLGVQRRPAAPASPTEPPAASSPAAPQPAVPIEARVGHAQGLMKQEKYWDAIQELESILPDVQTSAQRQVVNLLLARCVLKNPKWLHRGEELLAEVTRENPRHVEALLLLANVYRGKGLRIRAERALRQVLTVDPAHEGARAALAELSPPPEG